MTQFEMTDLTTFLENYKDVCTKELLESIWKFANEQYSKGYDKGYHGFDDDDN